MKNLKTSLENLSKGSLIENLMLDSIKGGCCATGTGSTFHETTKQSSRGIIVDTSIDSDVN